MSILQKLIKIFSDTAIYLANIFSRRQMSILQKLIKIFFDTAIYLAIRLKISQNGTPNSVIFEE
jgi:hypothetical protein